MERSPLRESARGNKTQEQHWGCVNHPRDLLRDILLRNDIVKAVSLFNRALDGMQELRVPQLDMEMLRSALTPDGHNIADPTLFDLVIFMGLVVLEEVFSELFHEGCRPCVDATRARMQNELRIFTKGRGVFGQNVTRQAEIAYHSYERFVQRMRMLYLERWDKHRVFRNAHGEP